MKKILVFMAIASMLIVGGCAQADFADVSLEDIREEVDSSGDLYLILTMKIANFTDSNLYIESASPADEKGEKHLWFILRDDNGNEYKPTYCSEIESDIFPMSISPKTAVIREMAFESPEMGFVLEVSQDTVGGNDMKLIYTVKVGSVDEKIQLPSP